MQFSSSSPIAFRRIVWSTAANRVGFAPGSFLNERKGGSVQPLATRSQRTRQALTARLLVVTLTNKTRLSSKELAPALISVPTSRPARLRTLRELKRGADVIIIIIIGGDVGDMVAIDRMMRQLAAARPPA